MQDCFGENRVLTLKMSYWIDQVAAVVWIVTLWAVTFKGYNYLSWFIMIYPSFLTIGLGVFSYQVLFKESSVYLYGVMIGAFAGQISITMLFAFGFAFYPYGALCAFAWIYMLCTLPLFVFSLMFKESIVEAETIAQTTVPVTPLTTVRTEADTHVTPDAGAGHKQFQSDRREYPPAVFSEAGTAGQAQQENMSTNLVR